MNNILAAQVLRSHLSEITDGAYKTAMEIAIETLYLDAINDWHKGAGDGLSAREYLELTEEEYCYWLLGKRDKNNDREKILREKIAEECKKKGWIRDFHIAQSKDYDFTNCPDDFNCSQDYTFSVPCDETSDTYPCEECWKNFLRGEQC